MIPRNKSSQYRLGYFQALYFGSYPLLPPDPPEDKIRLTAKETNEYFSGWNDGKAMMWISKGDTNEQ